MTAFLLDNANFFYLSSLLLLLFLALFEGLAQLLGFALLSLIDDLTPDFDLDTPLNTSSIGNIASWMSWLNFGRLPFMIWLTLLLSIFGLSGLIIQWLSLANLNMFLPNWIALPCALAITGVGLNKVGLWLVKVLPKNESSAVSQTSFIGSVGVITIGTAKPDFPAQAELVDPFNQKHFIMVAPVEGQLSQGQQVLILEKSTQGHFIAQAFQP